MKIPEEWLEDERICAARSLARRAHEGQTRKYENEPYVLHPERVAESFIKWADDKNLTKDQFICMVCAALEHDVIEDCPQISESEIEEAAAGLPVLNIVKELTNPSKRLKSLPRAKRKEIDREHLKNVSFQAKVIKLIDRLDNLMSMEACDEEEFILLYAKESELLLESLTEVDTVLVDAIRKQIANLRELCNST